MTVVVLSREVCHDALNQVEVGRRKKRYRPVEINNLTFYASTSDCSEDITVRVESLDGRIGTREYKFNKRKLKNSLRKDIREREGDGLREGHLTLAYYNYNEMATFVHTDVLHAVEDWADIAGRAIR